MARGVASPAPASLPKVSFVKIVGESSTARSGVHDNQQRSYGYNDFSLFERPQHYIRYIEPLESELAVQVEYDMDEQDQEWLDALNSERKKEQLDRISYEAFEIVMDRLEKEWFDLTKNIPKPDLALPSEDSTCAICDDSEGENTNAIVFCDGCNLAVHQDCYGVPYIPEGQWLCRKCTVSPENPVSCFLCPNEGGAFKQTVHGEWVHLLCAIWIPETRVANEVFMEPITGVERISKQRWKLKCSVCDIREGACIQCSKNSCFLAYHVTCARKEKFLMPMKASSGLEPPPLQCFCEKHMPREKLEARVEALRVEAALEHSDAKSSKSARAYAKTYKPGPPVVPSLILSRILQYINKIVIRKRSEFVELVCRYWSLKREVRRGAPLLKRLHLEPWTASTGNRVQTDEEKVGKLELAKRLRKDLVDVRALAELSRKRESRKLRQAQLVQEVLNQVVFTHEAGLRMAFENIVTFDRQGFFKNPISKSQVPDYFDVIQHPMWWNAIDEKLDRHEYWDIDVFRADINLVIDNAMRYNKPGTPYFKAAQRIKSNSATLLAELDRLKTPASSEFIGCHNIADNVTQRPVGDLEPPLAMLDLLTSQDIADELNIVLRSDPLQSLLSYELPELKPPPLAPVPPAHPSRKTKRERKVELARRRAEQRAAMTAAHVTETDSEIVDASVGPQATTPTLFPMKSAVVADTDPRGTTSTTASLTSVRLEDGPEGEQVLGKRKRPKPPSSQPGTDAENQACAAVGVHGLSDYPHRCRRSDPKVVFIKAGAIETSIAEDTRAAEGLSTERSLYAAGTSTGSGIPSYYHQTIGFSHAMDNSDIFSESMAWLPETDELKAFTPDSGRFLSGPGVIPMQQALPIPHDVGHEQDNHHSLIDEPMSLDDQQATVTTQPQSEELGGYSSGTPPKSSQAPTQAMTEFRDATPSVVIHEERPEAPQTTEPLSTSSDQPATPLTLAEARLKFKLEPNMTLSQDPDGKLDAKKRARSQLVAPVVSSTLEGSDLSSLSELSEDDDGKVHVGKKIEETKAKVPQPGEVVLEDGKTLEGGTLENFPWWAAVVFEPDDPTVPQKVLKSRPTKSKSTMGHHLVRFYDSSKSWQWVEIDQLLLLGENDELDRSLLTTSRRQKFSSAKMRQGCRESYRYSIPAKYEDDVLVEGSGDTPSTSTTNLAVANEELHSGAITL
ncbi:hypothetical protein BGW80DRAFT_1319898 [Lactifluus volemus]|nr:hypothetical protein BGW80DRAFT_1319898 [Lactifluus volemus]